MPNPGAPSHNGIASIVFAVLCAAALAPVLWFAIPPAMVDYPNHLARMFILSRAGGSDPQPYYEVTWALYPNLAMDLLVPQLGRLIGVATATRLFYLAGQILIVTGACAIERVVKGRFAIAPLVALMFLYSLPFAWGFVNFEFALGCALWGVALALVVQDRGWPARLALHSLVIAWLFAAHLFALGIYGFTMGVHELWLARSRRASLDDTAGRLAMLGLPALALIAAMIGSGGSVGGSGTNWFFAYKPLWLLHIMSGYSLAVSVAGVVALIALFVLLARKSALRFERSGGWLLAGFIALYIAMPSRLFDTSFVDLRVIVAAALIMPGFVSVSFPNAVCRRGALTTAAAIVLLNVAVVLGVWFSYRQDYAAAKASFARLPKGAIVLIGHSGEADDPPLRHLSEYPIYNVPVLAVHYANAFVPNLFTAPGKQPVTAKPAWQRLDVPYSGPVPLEVLKVIAEQGAPHGTPAFIRSWQKDFDYLYLLGPHIANPMPDLLDPVMAAPRFVLYRIRKKALALAH